MPETEEYRYFSNHDLDKIHSNYMTPIFDDIIKKHNIKTVLDYGYGNGLFGIYLKHNTQCKITVRSHFTLEMTY